MRIAVFASGSGTNLQALIDHQARRNYATGRVVWVASNRAGSGALARAEAAGITTHVIDKHADGNALLEQLLLRDVQLLVLAGYLKLVPVNVVRAYHGRMINIHPALLPAFGGEGMYGARVHEAVVASGATVTGPTVHFVDPQYDRGAIIAQWPVPIFAGDTPAVVSQRVLEVEHVLLPFCVDLVATGAVTLDEFGKRHVHMTRTDDINTSLQFALQNTNGVTAPELSLLFP